jgi:hypothetical protein
MQLYSGLQQMINDTAVKEWMTQHASEHRDGMALAIATMEHFNIEENWIWNVAQKIHDISSRQETSERYE